MSLTINLEKCEQAECNQSATVYRHGYGCFCDEHYFDLNIQNNTCEVCDNSATCYHQEHGHLCNDCLIELLHPEQDDD